MTSFIAFLVCLLLQHSIATIGIVYKPHTVFDDNVIQTTADVSVAKSSIHPSLFFEVTKPINTPATEPCTYQVLQHNFGSTYGKPPTVANYSLPNNCPFGDFSTIVLELNASSKGRQFDRIFGIWLGGVELLRSCTAEPTKTGIVWSVRKDVTRYNALLSKKETQELIVDLPNLVDETYTGVFHIKVTFYFYPSEESLNPNWRSSHANSIMPISQDKSLKNGVWFKIEGDGDVKSKKFVIPKNVRRAVLEVYVSFHEKDEFWYANVGNEYGIANNISGVPRNGPFREVVVGLDDFVLGAIWPFTVIHTGGFNPLLWRPITGIGSFDLPSYDIELTPFLGKILDGKQHKLSFSVTNSLNVWLVDANLHLWLDHGRERTVGQLLRHYLSPIKISSTSNLEGPNGKFSVKVRRTILSKGVVKSSLGKIITKVVQQFVYENRMEIGSNGDLQIVDQKIHFNTSVSFEDTQAHARTLNSDREFTLFLILNATPQGDDKIVQLANVSLGSSETNYKNDGIEIMTNSLKNLQNAHGDMLLIDGVGVSGVGGTQQDYKYVSPDMCYHRNITSYNYSILHDAVENNCFLRDLNLSIDR